MRIPLFFMILALLCADAVVFIMSVGFLRTDTVVFATIAIVFVVILAFLSADPIVSASIVALLDADTVLLVMIPVVFAMLLALVSADPVVVVVVRFWLDATIVFGMIPVIFRKGSVTLECRCRCPVILVFLIADAVSFLQ